MNRSRISATSRVAGICLACILIAACSSSSSSSSTSSSVATTRTSVVAGANRPCGVESGRVSYTHVIWIWEENHSYNQIIGSPDAPYINQVANECGLATNYHNVEHESLTNYLAAMSGQIGDKPRISGKDCLTTECPQPFDNLLNQLSTASSPKTWKVYAESMTTNCQGGADTELYVTRHAPGPYYPDVASTCATNDVPMTNDPNGGPGVTAGNFLTDLQNNTLPNFSFIGPNLCDDGHYIIASVPYCTPSAAPGEATIPASSSTQQIESDASLPQRLKVADNWLAAWLPAILDSPAYKSGNTIVFITWDEGELADYALGEPCWDQTHSDSTAYPSCQVPLLVISPSITPGVKPAAWLNHYNLLQATQQILGLPSLPSSPATGGVPTPNSLLGAFAQ